jgi:hypothetical protein
VPFIDVSGLLADSFIAGEAFQVIRRSEVIGDSVVPTITSATLNAFGSIVPLGDNSLLRAEAYETSNKSIQVITTFPLRASSVDDNGVQWRPDLVAYKGDFFLVKTLEDYTSYGAGMVVAECMATPYEEQVTQ